MTKVTFFLFLFSFQGISMIGQSKFLNQFQWENRILIIYENDENINQRGNQQQKTLLDEKNKLTERKLHVFRYNGARLKQVYPLSSVDLDVKLGLAFNEQYEMILIGLDGGIKKRYSKVQRPKIIFDLIDSMPMRQSEISQKF